MNNDVEDLVKHMPVLSSSNTFTTIQTTQPNMHAIALMGIFICGPMWTIPTGEYIFTVIDAYSRYSEAVLLKDTSSKSLIKELESIFSRHGYPLTLKTNNGLNLVSVEMENYLRSKGIHHAKSTTYWPRSNREVERYNRTFLKSKRAIHAKSKD